ncbi:MAG: hypothetical protein LBK83_08055 [Treponema sp.]|jgi:hypothetical protein|nr:hypothetical protein [Treponema sp.]
MKLQRYLPVVAGALMTISCGYKEFNPAGTSWALREDAWLPANNGTTYVQDRIMWTAQLLDNGQIRHTNPYDKTADDDTWEWKDKKLYLYFNGHQNIYTVNKQKSENLFEGKAKDSANKRWYFDLEKLTTYDVTNTIWSNSVGHTEYYYLFFPDGIFIYYAGDSGIVSDGAWELGTGGITLKTNENEVVFNGLFTNQEQIRGNNITILRQGVFQKGELENRLFYLNGVTVKFQPGEKIKSYPKEKKDTMNGWTWKQDDSAITITNGEQTYKGWMYQDWYGSNIAGIAVDGSGERRFFRSSDVSQFVSADYSLENTWWKVYFDDEDDFAFSINFLPLETFVVTFRNGNDFFGGMYQQKDIRDIAMNMDTAATFFGGLRAGRLEASLLTTGLMEGVLRAQGNGQGRPLYMIKVNENEIN